jgi:hypothetical protein
MRTRPIRRRLRLEQLENRRLLAADLATYDPLTKILTIEGTNKSDRITVTQVETVVENVTQTNVTVAVNKFSYDFANVELSQIIINGQNGNDWIWIADTVLANATINAGFGNDRVKGGGGNDTILGDKGNDRLHGGLGDDNISGGAGNDWAWGDDGDDTVHGDWGNDHVLGGLGNDFVYGDAGQDAVHGDEGDDTLYGGLGHDRLRGGADNDVLYGEENKDLLWGDDGNDQLFGGDDKDHLRGGWGDDVLKGEAGADHLDGGAGQNLLDGDVGANHFKNGFVVDLDRELVATLASLSSSGATGTATFRHVIENGAVELQLTITVDQWPIDQMNPQPVVLDITAASWPTPIGQITIGVDGHGSVTFSTSPDGDELAFPAGFTPTDGDSLTVGGDLTGSLTAAFA